jgi:AcrR family transcriptional regulator
MTTSPEKCVCYCLKAYGFFAHPSSLPEPPVVSKVRGERMGRRVTRQGKQQEPGAKQPDPVRPAVAARPRHRMAPRDRERLILDNAFRFFAERGLAGETRELARRLGVTQSLIYRYFPSKDVLIDRVYDKWFVEYWNPAWADWISDRRRGLEERLLAFYRDYARLLHNYEWIRLFAFSGMDRLPHHVRFVRRNRSEIFPRIARELRHDHGLPSLEEVPLTEFEHEQIWGMHATQFYIGQRRWLFGLPTATDTNAVTAMQVRNFVTAAPAQIAAHLATLQAKQRVSG